jgi:type IV fimbrial biogenesis protein FimT
MAMRQSTNTRRQRGVTLIEQVMTLIILAVLASIAMPSLQKLLARNQLQVAQMDFIAAMRHARETAVMSGKRSVLCPTTDGASCSGGSRWDGGWLIGHDADRNDQPDDKPLQVGSGYGRKLTILSNAGRHIARFLPDGSAGGSNLTLLICQPGSNNTALSVIVSNAGRIRGARATAEQAAQCTQASQ